ncbi:hypothetical protein [Streptomyces sp. NPDC001604]|uniref:hypothetical protein n=1 Tax=Streptomyces sp. NPDC001604 TaxID=3364593 RepID=UPI0036D0D63E
MEFGFDADGMLWLFQSRPITAMPARPPRGGRAGPGLVAEPLPGVLQPLEEDLWVAPMSHAITLALDIAGAASRRQLRKLPLVTTVQGRAAADRRLPRHTGRPPRPGLHQPRAGGPACVGGLAHGPTALGTAAAGRQPHGGRGPAVGRLPPPREMLSGQLLDAIAWGRQVLSSLHAQESLAGALLGPGTGATAAGEALAELVEGRGGA